MKEVNSKDINNLLDIMYEDLSDYADKISDLLNEVKEKYKDWDIEPLFKESEEGKLYVYLKISLQA